MAAGGGRAAGGFVGRAAELSLLEGGLNDALAGRARLFLVGGEPGIGKTRLGDELAERAAANGARVLWGRCWEGDATPPYWPWTQILRGYAHSTPADLLRADAGAGADDIASIAPEIGGVIGANEGAFGDARFRLFDSTALFLMRAATRQALVLVLDDMHAADESSLLLLHFCARELRNARILMLCTYRDAEVRMQPALASQFADLAREGRRLVLGGWDAAQVEESLRQRGDESVPPRLAAAIHRLTEGNPFFVDEVVRDIKGGRLDPSGLVTSAPTLPVPDGVRQTIRRRMASLPAETSALLELAAVIGREFDAEVLRRMRGNGGSVAPPSLVDVLAHLAPAVTAGLAGEVAGNPGRFAFSHALVRETLRNDLSASRRIALHLEVGRALENAGADAAPLAYHFFHAAPAGGAGNAVRYARLAGDDAQRRAAYEDAAAYYAQALDALEFLTPNDTWRMELLIARGHAQQRAGRVPEAREAFRRAIVLARARDEPAVVAQAVLGFGLVGETGTVDTELVSYLEDALERIGDTDGAARARLQARLAMALYFSPERGDRARRARLSAEALETARSLGDRTVLAATLIARHFVLWGAGRTDARLRLSAELEALGVEMGNLEIEAEARLWRAVDLLEAGDGSGFQRERAAYDTVARRLRMPLHLWHAEVLNALWTLAQGDADGAEARAESARDLGERHHVGRAAQFYAAQLFFIRRHQARLTELEPAARAFAERLDAVQVWKCGLALLYADLNRLDEARRALDVALAVDPLEWPADGNFLPGVAMLAEACAAIAAREHATRLRQLLMPYADKQIVLFDGIALLGPVSFYLGLLSATLEDPESARAHLESAVIACEALGATRLAHDARAALGRLTGTPPAPALAAPEGQENRPPMIFRSEGAYWSISYAGVHARLKHTRGLVYIAHMLRHPGDEFHALDLVAAASGGNEPAGAGRQRGGAERGSRLASGAADEMIDAQARGAYRSRLKDLQEELAEAEDNNDLGRIELLQEEIHAIAAELSRALGIGGRTRATTSDAERARVAVTKAILLAFKAIGSHNTALGRHLEATIRTGTFCGYSGDPEDARGWTLD